MLDYFHLSMRIQHVARVVKSWSDDHPGERAALAEAIEHVRWRLWHGQVQRALDLIGETLAKLDVAAERWACPPFRGAA